MEHHEKTKSSDYRYRKGLRILGQWHSSALQKDTEENFPQLRKGIPIQIQESHRNPTEAHKRNSPQHITKYTEQRKSIESCKKKNKSHI